MTKELLIDRPPIVAGPIVIDDYRFNEFDFPGEYVMYETFALEAFNRQIGRSKAIQTMRIVIRALINHLNLPILAPNEELGIDDEDDDNDVEPWGPYEPTAYYVEAHGYVKNARAIKNQVSSIIEDPDVIAVLEGVENWARDAVRHDTDRIPLRKLPGAFYTPQYPTKRIGRGHVLAYRDFQLVAKAVQTSTAKAAAVFDKVVFLLGNEEAKKHISELSFIGNPYSRRDIRETSYVKTQALASFFAELPDLTPELRAKFSETDKIVIRNVLYDEDAILNSQILDHIHSD